MRNRQIFWNKNDKRKMIKTKRKKERNKERNKQTKTNK